MPKLLKVYGVGDHGGGPTRRDLKKLLDMAAWPLYPGSASGPFGDSSRNWRLTGTGSRWWTGS